MTPSVSPQNALTDAAIFVTTVFAAIALILGPTWRSPHGAIVVTARCRSASRLIATATRERSYECELTSILIVILTPFLCNAGKGIII